MNPEQDIVWDEPSSAPLRLEVNGVASDEEAQIEWDEPPPTPPSVAPHAIDANPDRTARARVVAEATGLPTLVVERNLEAVEKKYRLDQIEEIAARDPALARALADPETAKIAHDDVEQISLVGEAGRSFLRFGGALAAAVPAINEGIWGTARAVGELVGATDFAEFAKARAAEQEGFAQALNPSSGNWALDAAYGGVQSAGQAMLTAPFGLAATLTQFGLTSFGHGYSDAREKGLTPFGATVYGAGQAAVEMGTELGPTRHLVDMFKGGRAGLWPTFQNWLKGEAVGEQVATLLQDWQEWSVLRPDVPFEQYLAERPQRAAETFVATAVTGGVTGTTVQALNAMREQRERAARAVEGAELVTRLLGDSAASKARARDPEAFRRYLADVTTDEAGDVAEVFIDAQVFQQSLAPEQLQELQTSAPEIAQQLAEATEIGGDVRIPVADFVTAFAGTPAGEALAQHVRRGADEMSAAEAVVFASVEQEAFRQEMTRAAEQMQQRLDEAEDQRTVFQQMLERLTRANRFSEDVNRVNAMIPAAIIQTMAARQGLSAQEFAARWLPNVVGENPAAPGTVLTATDDPQFRAWFGDSKVVDESGAPLVVYHGTTGDFDTFDASWTDLSPRGNTAGAGFFFADTPLEAEGYTWGPRGPAGSIMPVYLAIQNPYQIGADKYADPVYERITRSKTEAKAVRADLIAAGYDGIRTDLGEWIAFHPEQIKSVFNRGTWDPNDPNILRQSLSTRVPSAVKATEDPLADTLTISWPVVLADEVTLAKNVEALAKLPNFRKLTGKGAKSTARNVEAILDHMVENLLWLHDHVDPELRDRARLWYDGGRKMIDLWAERYGISPMQGAAAIAVLSPQNDWFQNVSMAERVADAVFGLRDVRWDDAMSETAQKILAGKADPKMDAAAGKTLGELLATPDVAARWIRVYDQTYNNRAFAVLTPEGGTAGNVTTASGANRVLAWKDYQTIAKAVSVLVDGRAENVHYQIGREHKVRNFYNNLFDPNSAHGFTTIDTHAVAAALLRPLAGSDPEVVHAFGAFGSSAITGLNGAYPIYLEAYRRAAEARGLQPRQMQSIAWEAVRGLFEGPRKNAMKAPAAAIWQRYKDGEIEQRQAQEEILALAGGITPPSWALVPYNDTPGRTYEGPAQANIDALPPSSRTPAVVFEVAPDPNDAALTEAWNALPVEEQRAISKEVAAVIVPQVLTELGTGGTTEVRIGGYLGATNPSLSLRLERAETSLAAARLLGYALAQDAMMVVSDRPVLGTTPVGTVAIELPEGYGAAEIAALYDRLWTLERDGERLVGGHTTADGQMVILNFNDGLTTEDLGRMVDEHLGGEFAVSTGEIHAAFIDREEYDYDADDRQGSASRATRRPRDLRAEATRLIGEALAARAAESGVYAQSARDAGAVRATTPVGSSPATGIHFSRQRRNLLDGRYYGTGIRGAEAERVFAADDRRLTERVYFYLDEGDGLRPEAGVGAFAHEVNLPTLYDARVDPLNIRHLRADPNAWESAILDGGYHGYFTTGPDQNIAVVIGPASRALQAKPVEPRLRVASGTGAQRPQSRYSTALMSKEIAAIDMEAIRAVAPSANLRMGTFTVEPAEFEAARAKAAEQGVVLPEQSLEQAVFHGTPHEFDAFSFDEIGSGEGAQAYGWGLYFADAREVAADYRKKLSAPISEYTVDGRVVPVGKYGSPEHIILTALADGEPQRVQRLADDYRRIGDNEKADALLAQLAEFEGKVVEKRQRPGGRLLRADVPDEAIGRMLLWDAPLNEQPPAVREALRAAGVTSYVDEMEAGYLGSLPPAARVIAERMLAAPEGALTDGRFDKEWRALERLAPDADHDALHDIRDWYESKSGADLYHELANARGSDRAASEYLASIGIPGNRYLDQGSRGKGGGTYNTVVWDQAVLDEINASLIAEFEQRTEQPRGTYSPSTNTIALLEKADLSTFLHEVGHWGLEILVEAANKPGAPQQIVDDARTLLGFAGVDSLQAWNAMTLEERREHHEKVAEAFETYLFEGRAPSAELQGAFSRIAQWMKNVYRALTGMRVQLTDEVRGVFDRMLATDEQIAEQSRIRDMAPLFETAEAAGMTPEQWQAYQAIGMQAAMDAADDLRSRSLRDMKWLANAKGRALKKLQAQAKEARKGLRAEVEEEVDAQPVYAALRFIQRGEAGERDLTNAQRRALDTVAGGKTKLDLGVLKEMYGDSWPILATRLLPLTAAEGGAHPDAVATAFGFDSGDALVRAILAAEPREQLVEALTDRRMLERHADLADPEALERAAEAAIHNEARIRFVATEYKALADGMNVREQVGETTVTRGRNKGQVRAVTVNSLVRAANQYAAAIVGRTVVRKLNVAMHARAAANESRAARAAMAEGNLQKALAHKRNQLLHERTARAVEDARVEADKAIGYLKKFRNSNRARGSIDADYVEAIENLLAAIDLRSQTNRRLESLASLRKWMADQEAEGLPVALDPDLIESLQVQNVRDMTVEQLRGLVDQVRSIEHLGKLKKKLLTARDQREFDTIAEALAESIREHGGKKREIPFAPGAAEHDMGRRIRAFFAEHRKLASFARQMDGVVDDGPMWRALIRGMNDAGNRETSLIAHSTRALADIFKPLVKMRGGLTGDKRLIPSLGQSLSRGERLAVALNWGNEANRQRVLNTVPMAAVDEIFATLTHAEWDAVEAVWAHIDEFWPDIAAKQKRVTGIAPEKVEAAPFVVRVDGQAREVTGGYYPIVYESEISDVAAAHENAQIAKDMLAGAYTRSTTRRGHLEKRMEKVGEPLRFTLDVIERHISQVVHDLAWHEWLIDANRLLKDRRISSAIREHYSNEVLQAMRRTLQDIATGDLQRQGQVAKTVGAVRARVGASVLAFKATVSLLQPFGLFQSIPRIGAKWVLRGMKHWAGDIARFENSARLIREKSEMMRHRSTTFNRDIREITGRVHRGKSKAAEVFEASMFVAIQKMQLVADIPTWWGAYEKAMAEADDEARAVALADQAVLDAQGGGMVKDLAGVQRGGELMKSLSMLYSFFSATHQITVEQTSKTDFRRPAQVAGWLADMVVLSVVPVLAQQVVFAMIRGGDGGDDEEFVEKAADLGIETLAFVMNTLIGVRELSGIVQGFDYSGPVVARAVVEAGNLARAAKKAIDPDEELEDGDYRRAVKAVLTFLGWPAGQVDAMWRGWRAYEEGEAGPGSIILGPPPRER